MTRQKLNFFIIDENRVISDGLRRDLHKRFATQLDISIFNDKESCLKSVKKDVDVVLINSAEEVTANDKNYNPIMTAFKTVNPNVKVITHSTKNDIGTMLESVRLNSDNAYVEKVRSNARIIMLLNKYVKDPILMLAREFGISKFSAIFLVTFLTVGIVVFITLKLLGKY